MKLVLLKLFVILIGVIAFAFIAKVVYQSIQYPNNAFFIDPIGHLEVASDDKVIALTFDDGPSPNHTLPLLELLKKHQVKATFFLIGEKIKMHLPIAQKIQQEGHQIANHTYRHDQMIFKSKKNIRADLQKTDSLVLLTGEKRLNYFRAPYGKKFINLPLVLLEQNKKMIGWSVNPVEQYQPQFDPKKIIEQTISSVKNGGIILLHDGWDNIVTRDLIDAVEEIIVQLKKEGYRFVTIEEGINLK